MANVTNSLDQAIAQCNTLVQQCVIAANECAAAVAFIANANPAPLNSPAFTGIPTAPTAAQNTNSNQLATCAYLDRLMGAANGIPTLDNTGHIPTDQLPSAVLGGLDYQGTWNANTNSPALASGVGTTGFFYLVSTAGTTTLDGISSWAVGDQVVFGMSTWQKVPLQAFVATNFPLSGVAPQAANTFVANATAGSASPTAITAATAAGLLPVAIGDSGSGGVKGLVPAPAAGDYVAGKYLDAGMNYSVPPVPNLSAYALLDSPAFINTPTAPTLAVDTNSTGLATCAFVLSQAGSANPIIDGVATPGTSTRFARQDHVHPTDTTRAPVASPTLTGTPAAPTPGTNVNTTQIPTTAWVNTYFVPLTTLSSYALLASPTFTGIPAVPTASPGTNTTQIATCAFVEAAVAGVGPAAGAGISVAGSTVSIDTNNVNGVGSFAILVYTTAITLTNGSMVTSNGTGDPTFATISVSAGIGVGANVPAGQVWRNVSGNTIDNNNAGLCVRVS